MTKEEIEEELLSLSEEDDDYNKVRKAYNLGIQTAAEYAKTTTYVDGYSTAEQVDKESILKLKI